MMLFLVILFTFAFSVLPPSPHGPIPTEAMLKYHREELSAFIHYGMNTYTGKEWGDGSENPNLFRPTNLDTDQWVETMTKAGFKRVIIVGRHHDGFCNWKTKYSRHQVNESKDFQDISQFLHQSGDVLEELSKSCTKYNLDMGLYLSPWDVNSPYYGDEVKYNEYYMNQLEEILHSENNKYGNNGQFVEVWMDGAKGTGSKAQVYWFLKWFDLIRKYNPQSVIFSGYGSEVRWVGNEAGIAGVPCWNRDNYTNQRCLEDNRKDCIARDNNHGDPKGPDYSVAECDVSVTSGWFWTAGKVPKTMAELATIYFSSVGRGQPLLLNIPPNKEGKFPQNFVDRILEFGETIKKSFMNDLAREEGVKAEASSVRGNDATFSPSNVLNDDETSYWTMDDSQTTGWIIVDLGQFRTFDVVSIKEHIQLGQRIAKFEVDVHLTSGEWQLFDNTGETIGYRHLSRNYKVTADKVRVRITQSQAVPLIQSISVYKSYGEFSMGDPVPDGLSEISVNQMTLKGTWNSESEGIWTKNIGATAESKFTGTKCYISGIIDPAHGLMEVFIDNVLVSTVDCKGSARLLRQILFVSDDLENKEHTLKLRLKTVAIAIHSFYYLNNGGGGMFEFQPNYFEVNEGDKVKVNVKRVAGSVGDASVTFQTAPGSAVHGKNFKDITTTLEFKGSQPADNIKTVEIQTLYNAQQEEDLNFFGQIVDPHGAIVGFNSSAEIIIKFVKQAQKNIDDMKVNLQIVNQKVGDNEEYSKDNGKFVVSSNVAIFVLSVFCVAFAAFAFIVILKKFAIKRNKDGIEANPILVEKTNYTV